MLITANYPSKIHAVRAGRRQPEDLLVWRRVSVNIADGEKPTPSFDLTLRHGLSIRQRAHEDAWLFAPVPFTRAYLRSRDSRLVYNAGTKADLSAKADGRTRRRQPLLLGLSRHEITEFTEVFEALPRIRRLIEDFAPQEEALASEKAAERFFVGRKLFTPVPEPYFFVKLDRYGRYESFNACIDGTTNNPNAFRLDDLGGALAFAQTAGATRDDTDLVRENVGVRIHDADMLRFDQLRHRLIATAHILVDFTQFEVGRLPMLDLIAWATLRDRIPGFTDDPTADIASFATQVRHIFNLFGTDEFCRRYGLVDVEATLAGAEALGPPASEFQLQ